MDELAAQIKMEFDFEREASVMDAIRGHLKGQGALRNIDVPRSIPGLTSKRLLVMSYIDGVQARAPSVHLPAMLHDAAQLHAHLRNQVVSKVFVKHP